MNRYDIVGPNNNRGEPRIFLISSWNEKYADLADIAVPNFANYCQQHGYALRVFPGEYHEDPSRPETFGDKGKFELFYDVKGHCDIVVWLDIDSLIMNPTIKVEHNLRDKQFLWTFDDSGPLSGLLIARTTDVVEKALRRAYERAVYECNVRHGKIEPNGISDQDSMRDLMNIPPFSNVFGPQNCLPADKVGHCYESNYYEGAWLITFPGMSMEEKRAKMHLWDAKVKHVA